MVRHRYDNSYIRNTADGIFDDNKKRLAAEELANAKEAATRTAKNSAKLKTEQEFLAKASEIKVGKVRRVDVDGIFNLREEFLSNRQNNIEAILGGDRAAITADRELEGKFLKEIIDSEGLQKEQDDRNALILGDNQFNSEDNMNTANIIDNTSKFSKEWNPQYTTNKDGTTTFTDGVQNFSNNITPTININSIIKNAVKDIDMDMINSEYTNVDGGKEIVTKKSVADETLYASAFTAITNQKYPDATNKALEKAARKHGDKYLDDEDGVDIKEYVMDVARGNSNRGLASIYSKDSTSGGNNESPAATEADIIISPEPMSTETKITGGEGSSLIPTSGNLSGNSLGLYDSGVEFEKSRADWNTIMGLEADNPYIDYSGENPAVQYVPQGNSVMAASKPTKNAKRTFQFQSPPNTRNVSSRKSGDKNIPPGLLSKSEIFDVSPTDVRMMRTATEDINVSMVDVIFSGNKTFNLTVKKGDWIPEWAFQSANQDVIDALKSTPYKSSPWLMAIDEHKTSKPTIAAEFTPALFKEWSAWMIDNQENPYLYINAMKKEIFGIEGESK